MVKRSQFMLRWVPFFIAQSLLYLHIFILHDRNSSYLLSDWNVGNDFDMDAPIVIRTNNINKTSRSTQTVAMTNTTTTWLPLNPQLYFIHVGKAGGTTIHKSMELELTVPEVICLANESVTNAGSNQPSKCRRRKFAIGTSALEKSIVGFFHMMGVLLSPMQRAWLMNNTNVFLFTVREPIDRLISTYNYHRGTGASNKIPTKLQFYDLFYNKCFPGGLEDMITMLRNNTKPNCTPLGMNTLTGRALQGGWHFMYNYIHYKNYTMDQSPDHAVAVIRTEHLWDDVVHLDKLLGGTGDFGNHTGTKSTHGSEKYQYNNELSESNTVFLCCLLHKDLESYQAIILRALNLEYDEKQEALSHLLNRCQVKVTEDDTTDLVQDPFSWEEFRLSQVCRESLGNLR
jgi:hypothetical protein